MATTNPGFVYATTGRHSGTAVGIAVDEKTGKSTASVMDPDTGVVKNFTLGRLIPAANGYHYSGKELDNIVDAYNNNPKFIEQLGDTLNGDFAYNSSAPYDNSMRRLIDLTINRPGHMGYRIRHDTGERRFSPGSVYSDIYYDRDPYSQKDYNPYAGLSLNPFNWTTPSYFPAYGDRSVDPIKGRNYVSPQIYPG